jgi:ElaB/YqjD/DUF883 family membrane-anchored ribosome-binding protein
MPSDSSDATGKTEDVMTQIGRLRDQVETLIRDRVGPAFNDATSKAGAAVQGANEAVRFGADEFARAVRAEPLVAVAVAAAIGFVLGRISR